jgi:hypothetical protein
MASRNLRSSSAAGKLLPILGDRSSAADCLSAQPAGYDLFWKPLFQSCRRQDPETDIVVAVGRRVVVAIGRTDVLRIIVPAAAPENPVRAYDHTAEGDHTPPSGIGQASDGPGRR